MIPSPSRDLSLFREVSTDSHPLYVIIFTRSGCPIFFICSGPLTFEQTGFFPLSTTFVFSPMADTFPFCPPGSHLPQICFPASSSPVLQSFWVFFGPVHFFLLHAEPPWSPSSTFSQFEAIYPFILPHPSVLDLLDCQFAHLRDRPFSLALDNPSLQCSWDWAGVAWEHTSAGSTANLFKSNLPPIPVPRRFPQPLSFSQKVPTRKNIHIFGTSCVVVPLCFRWTPITPSEEEAFPLLSAIFGPKNSFFPTLTDLGLYFICQSLHLSPNLQTTGGTDVLSPLVLTCTL